MDWYRKKTWTKKDEEEFFLKLKRAHGVKRPQYLRIKAVSLIDTKKSELYSVAEFLLLKLLEEYPDVRTEKSLAYNLLGEIFLFRSDLNSAIGYFKKSIAFEKEFPNVKTSSYLDYSELIIKNRKTEHYQYVKELITSRIDSVIFPVEKYKLASILSIIYKSEDSPELAKKYAEIAEENAKRDTSGLSHYRKKHLGLVKERTKWLDDQVRENKKTVANNGYNSLWRIFLRKITTFK